MSLCFRRKKKHTWSLVFFVVIFFIISSTSFIVFSPKYYDDPLSQTSETLKQGDFGFISFPSIHNDNIFRTLATYHTTLIPYSFDYYDLNSKEVPYSLSNTVPFTYTSVPLALFFFVGMGYLLNSIYRKKLIFSEFILLIWFSSLFILTILTVSSFWVERFYVPLFFPILFIASYGIYLFIKKIKNKKIQISFFVFFIFTHIVTTLNFWNVLYQSPDERWGNPLTEMNLQTAFENPVVIVSSLLFVIWYIFIVINTNFKKKDELKLKKKSIGNFNVLVIILFLIPALLVTQSVVYGMFADEVILYASSKKTVSINNEKIFSIMADVENYPKILPKYESVEILNREENAIYTKEILQERGIKITLLAKHTIIPYEKHVIEIIEGDVKGTIIELIYERNGLNTIIQTNLEIHLQGILAPLGVTFQYTGIYDSIEKSIDAVITKFENFAKLESNT